MSKEKSNQEKVLVEKEKALDDIKHLIANTNATLDTKYLESHGKVAILLKDHIIELCGGEEKFIKYMVLKIPIANPGSLPALSRYYSVAAYQLFNYQCPYMPSGAYNAELVKQLTPEMQNKIKNYGTPLTR